MGYNRRSLGLLNCGKKKKKAQHVMSSAVEAQYCKPYCFAQNECQEKRAAEGAEFFLYWILSIQLALQKGCVTSLP